MLLKLGNTNLFKYVTNYFILKLTLNILKFLMLNIFYAKKVFDAIQFPIKEKIFDAKSWQVLLEFLAFGA